MQPAHGFSSYACDLLSLPDTYACMQVKFEPVEGGRPKMVEVEDSVETIEADMVLLALGFLGPEERLANALGIHTDPRSNYQANTEEWETSLPVRSFKCLVLLCSFPMFFICLCPITTFSYHCLNHHCSLFELLPGCLVVLYLVTELLLFQSVGRE